MIEIDSKYISKLNLSNLDLVEFPIEILELKNLKKLNLSNNRIQFIPKEIEESKNLELLDLSNNSITNFYSKICTLKKLKTLNLNNNRIKTIPKQINQLELLKTLHIANNNISSLPKSFSQLKNLNKLNLSKNNFENFPAEILAINSLTHLWINNLDLKKFPKHDIIKNLRNLKALYCFGTSKSVGLVDDDYFKLSRLKGNCKEELIEIIDGEIFRSTKKQLIKPLDQRVKKNKIFISYSHKDLSWLTKIQTNLKVLRHNDKDFELWDDTRIKAGDKWKIEIANALKDAGIAILIISTDFLASDFIRSDELPTLLRNAKNHGTRILPLIVRPSLFIKDKYLSEFQAVNSPEKPLSTLTESQQENELVRLTSNVSDILEEN